jgi:hypothetical protein
MSKFSITYSTGQTAEVGNFDTLYNYALHVVRNGDTAACVMGKKTVTAAEVVAEHDRRAQAAWDKKAETHKRVTVRHGASATCFVEKWVRK